MTVSQNLERCRVTVVVAVKDASTTIDRCLGSIRDQSVNLSGDLHVALYDSLSQDGTSDVIEAFIAKNTLPNVDYMREADHGLYDAWNKGVKLAKSEYVFFLNADDYFHNSDVLRDMISVADLNESALTSGYTQMVNPVGRLSYGGGGGRLWSMCWKMSFVTPATLFRLSSLREVGDFSRDWRVSSDYDLMIRMLKENPGRVSVFKRPVVHFATDGLSNNTMRELGFLEARHIIKNHFGMCGLIIRRVFEFQEAIKRLIYKLIV